MHKERGEAWQLCGAGRILLKLLTISTRHMRSVSLIFLLALMACAAPDDPAPHSVAATPVTELPAPDTLTGPGLTGTILRYEDVPSAYVPARSVEVWLPPGYDADSTRYPVLYMQDGQNVFNPATSYTGIDWGVDETMTRLIAEGAVPPAIVVAAYNTEARWAEYFPEDASHGHEADNEVLELSGNAYVRFLAEELKPAIDRTFRTRPGRAYTAVMGSSMGGLVSLYALLRYPEVFGAVGAVSTHWPALPEPILAHLDAHLPEAGAHRLYFDHGTETLDAEYGPWQARADSIVAAHGYTPEVDWHSEVFEGADHSEQAWQTRVHVPLTFLLAPMRDE